MIGTDTKLRTCLGTFVSIHSPQIQLDHVAIKRGPKNVYCQMPLWESFRADSVQRTKASCAFKMVHSPILVVVSQPVLATFRSGNAIAPTVE